MNLLLTIILSVMQLTAGSPQTGTLSGRIDIKTMPPRQAASRYPSTGGQMQKEILPIPPVVYIEGLVPGAPAWPRFPKAAITQKDFQFYPALLIIPTGTSVAFPNEDSEFHNVFSYSKSKRFDLGRYPKGESKSVFFDKPGVVKIYCEVHPWMRTAVLVLENPFYAIVAEDGTFSIKEIPPGHYDLVLWSIDAGTKKIGVDVAAEKKQDLQLELHAGPARGSTDQFFCSDQGTPEAADTVMAITVGACCAKKR